MSQGVLCLNVTNIFQAKVSKMANYELPIA